MLLLTVAVALVSAVTSANAQSQSSAVRANIPFDFMVGSKALPAGQYICRRVTDTNDAMLQITSVDGHESAVRLTQSAGTTAQQTTARLVFHGYGDRYFLTQVWTSGTTGRELLKSKAERAIEREVAKNPSPSETAQKASASETVTIIASLQ